MRDHVERAGSVFGTSQRKKLSVHLSKCTLGANAVEYLEHQPTNEGMSVDPRKVEATQKGPRSRTRLGVQPFFRIANYYRRLNKNFFKTLRPLANQTRNAPFHWN